MVIHMANNMDIIFAALADGTRRDVVERLTRGPAAIKELAEPHDMALPSFLKHIDRLEKAGIVTTRKDGRQRIVELTPATLTPAKNWLGRQKRDWEARLDRLEAMAVRLEAETNPFDEDDR